MLSLVSDYAEELTLVSDFFFDQRDNPTVSANLPATSGAIAWCKGLIERIDQPLLKLQGLNNRKILDNDESREIIKRHYFLRTNLDDFIQQHVSDWGRDVENVANLKLKMKLIKKNKNDGAYLEVNFDKQLKRLLREVRYFLLMGLIVPEKAEEIFEKTEYFRGLNFGLHRIVDTYNNIIETMLPVEAPLLKNWVDAIEASTKKGIDIYDWNADGLEVFVETARIVCIDAATMMSELKTNLQGCEDIISELGENPLLERQSKAMSPKDLLSMNKTMLKEQYHHIKEGGAKIHALLKESMKSLKVSQHSADWLSYLDFANNVVSEGLASNAVKSLHFLLTQLKGEEDTPSMLAIELKLLRGNIVFDPSIFETNEDIDPDAPRTFNLFLEP
tara:strand:+ start:730 stop:1896 length:1167 start_codon:yes stop_codon:yes gene_type:complete